MIQEKSLISGYIDLDTQLTPNGFDLTVASVYAFSAAGAVDFSNKERIIPETTELFPKKKNQDDKFGWWNLNNGIYKIKTNEIVKLSNDIIAFSFPRSSLLRSGVFTHTGVWDAGFEGKSEFILMVANTEGICIKQNARVVQLVFEQINQTGQGYNGIYQNAL